MTKRILPKVKKTVDTADMVWGSADGTYTRLGDMTLDHFVNVLNWINKDPELYRDILSQFHNYATDMSFIKFSAGERYPLYNAQEHVWRIMDPEKGIVRAAKPPKEFYVGVAEKYGEEFLYDNFGVKLV